MRFPFLPAALLALVALTSCSQTSFVTRKEAVETAWKYSIVEWTPQARHLQHGPDADGILVHTPDESLAQYDLENGWWKVDEPARGMPYQWGGFDTPESFKKALEDGKFAGDISTTEKQKLGDAGVSKRACGIDCSGLISRCWKLRRPYSTKQLPSICRKLPTWDDLKPGDILLNYKHVLMFTGWQDPGKMILAYEAGPLPYWRVNSDAMLKSKLVAHGYTPWRYRGIID